MTVTETDTKANTPTNSPPVRAWGEGDPKSCYYRRTYYQNGLVQQQMVPCRALDCDYCGPKKREADLKVALQQFAAEETVFLIIVPAWKVDHVRKWANRRDAPIKSVPISQDENAVFCTERYDAWVSVGERHEGAHLTNVEEVRRIFRLRISKRQLTSTGRWFRKPMPAKESSENGCVTIAKVFIGEEAFRRIAERLGAKVKERGDTIYFPDTENYGPEFYKKLLLGEEARVRAERHRRRGWRFWGGEWYRVQPSQPEAR